MEIGRNYASIIITIINNITVPVSHNVLCFGCFMPISHGIKKKAPTVVSPPTTPPSYQIFIKFVCCFARITLSTLLLLWSIRLLQKIMIFQVKAIFFFQLIVGLFRFCCFICFLGCFFTVLTSWSYGWLKIWMMHSFLFGVLSNHVA